eukprot:gene8288-biopygen22615
MRKQTCLKNEHAPARLPTADDGGSTVVTATVTSRAPRACCGAIPSCSAAAAGSTWPCLSADRYAPFASPTLLASCHPVAYCVSLTLAPVLAVMVQNLRLDSLLQRMLALGRPIRRAFPATAARCCTTSEGGGVSGEKTPVRSHS